MFTLIAKNQSFFKINSSNTILSYFSNFFSLKLLIYLIYKTKTKGENLYLNFLNKYIIISKVYNQLCDLLMLLVLLIIVYNYTKLPK